MPLISFALSQKLDQLKEEHRGEDAIGTTGRGIGPAYVSKISRAGIRAADLFHPQTLKEKVKANLEDINKALIDIYDEKPIDADEISDALITDAEKLKPFIKQTSRLLHKGLADNEDILLEGAQGSLLDLDHGSYPYVTSSSPTAGGACTGTGLAPAAIEKVMGITKAYCTRVGNGPFPTELQGKTGEKLRREGQEFGATTGRPRRCGWIDLVALKYVVKINGMNELAITKLDILNSFEKIKLCIGYKIGDERTNLYPTDLYDLKKAEPVYKTMNGWESDVTNCNSLKELPNQTQAYIGFIESYLDVKVNLLSIGPKRSETLVID